MTLIFVLGFNFGRGGRACICFSRASVRERMRETCPGLFARHARRHKNRIPEIEQRNEEGQNTAMRVPYCATLLQ